MNYWEERRKDIQQDDDLDADEKKDAIDSINQDEQDLRRMNDREVIQQLEEICDHDDDIKYLYELLRRMGHANLMTNPYKDEPEPDEPEEDCSAGHDWSDWEYDEDAVNHHRVCERSGCDAEEIESHARHGHDFGRPENMHHHNGEIRAEFECEDCGYREQRGNKTGTRVIRPGNGPHGDAVKSDSKPQVQEAPEAIMPGEWIE